MFVVGPCISERLYLTRWEAIRFAEQIRQELVCRTVDQLHDPLFVADVSLHPAEAWQILGWLEIALPHGRVDWLTEGF